MTMVKESLEKDEGYGLPEIQNKKIQITPWMSSSF